MNPREPFDPLKALWGLNLDVWIGPYGEIQTKGKEPRHRVHETRWITDTYKTLIKMQLAGKTPVSVEKLLADGKIRIEDVWYVRG